MVEYDERYCYYREQYEQRQPGDLGQIKGVQYGADDDGRSLAVDDRQQTPVEDIPGAFLLRRCRYLSYQQRRAPSPRGRLYQRPRRQGLQGRPPLERTTHALNFGSVRARTESKSQHRNGKVE